MEIVTSVEQLGQIARRKRKADRVTQADLALVGNAGRRCISDFENGKHTVEIGKVFAILQNLGLTLYVE